MDPRAIYALHDRYRIVDEIGRGGMATVYRAHDVKHDRTVALKVLHEDLAASLGPERFKREIRIAARLQHPHILSVHDSGEAAGRLWFTMPFVSGESLRDRIRREERLPVDAALGIIREAAQALAYAHKQGVIHRDIKPENILLTEDGATLVADFGIARAVGDDVHDTSLTQTGSTIGTPAYMAPEQATGAVDIDERVDQYALAAVLYELLTGAPPFVGTNAAALMAARYTSAVTPVRAQREDVPQEVDTALQRALSLKPFERFPSIAEFARSAAPATFTPSQFSVITPRRTHSTPSRRNWLIGAAVLSLVVAGSAFLRKRDPAPAGTTGPIRIAVLPLQNVGDSADAYFADGMGDELRATLVNVPGLEVIARASSVQIARSGKSPEQIANDLGVRYLLAGTLRYERRADGTNEMHVRPELLEVRGDGAAVVRWQSAFDGPLANASALQATIAERVAGQLQLTLGAATRAELAKPPTTNAEAYDAYLRGMAALAASGREAGRQRITDFERAVELDPNFVPAWRQLASAIGDYLVLAVRTPELLARARYAVERVRALAPGSLDDHRAWAVYYRDIEIDPAKQERELRAALALAPNDQNLTGALALTLEESGRWSEAEPLLEAATRIDPLRASTWANYGGGLMVQRRYRDARAPLRRLTVLSPQRQLAVLFEVSNFTALGDLAQAKAVVRDAYTRMPPLEVDLYLTLYREFSWVLDDSARVRVLRAPLEKFDNDVGQQQLAFAQIHRLRTDVPATQAAARLARPAFEAQARRAPEDTQAPLFAAFAAALAGQHADTEPLLREFERRANSRTLLFGEREYSDEIRARIFVLGGQYDRAFDVLDDLFAKPGRLAPRHLDLDPMWTPLRTRPRYQRIMLSASAQESR